MKKLRAPRDTHIYQSRWLLKFSKVNYFLFHIGEPTIRRFSGKRKDRCLHEVLQLPLSKRDDVTDETLTSGLNVWSRKQIICSFDETSLDPLLEGESEKGEH